VNENIQLRWLGVAGIELTCKGYSLAIDPFFTRPPFRRVIWGRPRPDEALTASHLPRCDAVLVSHSHYDHLMDVPAIAHKTGAAVYGSANTCQIASIQGLSKDQIHEVSTGSTLQAGPFSIEIHPTEHIQTPVDRWINGPLPEDLRAPLRLRDYRMDSCFSFLIRAGDMRILFNKQLLPADVLIFAPLRAVQAYTALLQHVRPQIVIPIHWDNFFRPLSKSLKPLPQPPRLLWPGLNNQRPEEFKRQIEQRSPEIKVHIPMLFKTLTLNAQVCTSLQPSIEQPPLGPQNK